MTETIENVEEFIKERKEYFKENVLPITHGIANAIFSSSKLTQHDWNGINHTLTHNGVCIEFRGNTYIGVNYNTYSMTIKYGWFGFKTVLKYYHSIGLGSLDVFHECEWIDKLNGLVEKIQHEDAVWKRKRVLKKYKRKCKNLSKKESCALD